jgi:hypothetical protein
MQCYVVLHQGWAVAIGCVRALFDSLAVIFGGINVVSCKIESLVGLGCMSLMYLGTLHEIMLWYCMVLV